MRSCPSVRLAAAAVAAATLLTGCGGASKGAAAGPVAASSEAATTRDGVQHLTVHATDDLHFTVTRLTAATGKVDITLVVDGKVPHNLMFRDGPMGGTQTVQHGSSSVTLVFNTPGTYHFLCTIHPQMTGTLTVS